MNECLHCHRPTSNVKFCCCSCSVSYNNVKFPKRKPEHQCIECGAAILSGRKYCNKCKNYSSDITLETAIYTRHHKSSAFALVRTRARALAKRLKWKKCHVCGYSKHVEICHRKAISEFPLSALLSEINDPRNLVALCPNCHWEFDNNLLTLLSPCYI